MRIVIDLQGAQTASRFRGIGRYSLALSLAIARNAKEHEIWLVLNAALPDSIPELRAAFDGLVPRERIRVFDLPGHTAECDAGNLWRTRAAETIREHVIAALQPDAVLVTSLFEGYVDDGVTSVGSDGNGANTAVILYDLIPLLNPAAYLPTPPQREYYDRKIASLRNAGLLLSISDYSRQEGLEALGVAPERIVSISTAVDNDFVPSRLTDADTVALHQRFGITRKMVMYAPGGFDTRKNIDGLITAYSLLPPALRATHQLVVASKLGDVERTQLDQVRIRAGLANDELVLTGYVADADLRGLYSTAALFVFPSKHEGFGLPALEAMACGAPVIGSCTTSLPEVIGLDEAMFDPTSPQAIADKMQQVLEDDHLRRRLLEHGKVQAKKFSWDVSARRALRALEAHHARRTEQAASDTLASTKPRLAFVSPLPPERTGIANYSVELLPALMQHYDIELVSDQREFALPPALAALPRRTVGWFAENGSSYDRIVYQVGNSPFHSHMFGLLHQHPGTVVLHDFFLSGALAYEETTGRMPGVWSQALYYAHGYIALQTRCTDAEEAKRNYPCNLDVLQAASGLIVHSDYSRVLARKWYGPDAGEDWTVIPHLRTAATSFDRAGARKQLGIGEDAFVVCSFGFVDPTKLTHRLLEAWLASPLRTDPRCELVLVGENHGGEYGAKLLARIRECGMENKIRITGWTDDEVYNLYLQAADASVQLRTMSRGETSGAVLHCLNYGLPTIVNANGSMADLAEEAVWKLPDEFADAELVTALATLWSDSAKRHALAAAARTLIQTRHDPARCAEQYAQAIEAAHRKSRTGLPALLQSLADLPTLPGDEQNLQRLAQAVARSTTSRPQPRQLLVDVSAIARNDLQTGIERVVRAQLVALLRNPPQGFRVEPVVLSDDGGAWHYSYAREYTQKLLGIASPAIQDTPVDIGATDVFYSPDFFPSGVIEAARAGVYADWRARGVEVNFLVHDILPILRPEFFPEGTDQHHAAWLSTIATHADRLVCISQAVADEVQTWLTQNGHARVQRLKYAVVHHGADIGASVPSSGMPDGAEDVLQRIGAAPSFLMVGTIEPRKGHLQAIAAFEQLWRNGVEANLVIVGKEGWKALPEHLRRTIPQIVGKLTMHPELGKRLFWLQGISDEYLQKVYAASTCLVFASEGEGFGLPLIEAAQTQLPIIARGLPVFREVAQQHAFYFDGLNASDLAAAVCEWLALREEGRAPSSMGMPWLTWAENAAELGKVLSGDRDRLAGSDTALPVTAVVSKAA
ncbi:MAG TPA: glycosyltransferase [Noviherbaspirillum sp.]